MRGATACGAHLRPANLSGRPTLLDERVTEQIVAVLRAGNYVNVAARAAGISRQAFGDWMRRGLSSGERDRPYREFRERVEAAMAEGEVRNVALIAAAAAENWLAAAWLLERHFPERWGKSPARRLPTVPPEEAATAPASDERGEHELDAFAEVDELAAKRLARKTS